MNSNETSESVTAYRKLSNGVYYGEAFSMFAYNVWPRRLIYKIGQLVQDNANVAMLSFFLSFFLSIYIIHYTESSRSPYAKSKILALVDIMKMTLNKYTR